MRERILVVDDDTGFRGLLTTILAGEQYVTGAASTVAEALGHGESRQYDLVLTDLKLPDGDGLDVLRWFREHAPETPVIMITAFGTVATAVEAMKIGAVDYLGKPLASPDELRVLVRKTLDQQQIARERDALIEEQAAGVCGSMIARDPRMTALFGMLRKVAPTNATILLTGESGTGKELLARCIHQNSPRRDRVFVAVNCAALAPSLIESELFGHEKGSFTGAGSQHLGRFERAHGGTIFLDEIAELDASLQTKLLRVLQERMLERVGGARQIAVDVRVIAATNRDIKQMTVDGSFRSDLYYRLSTFPLEIPPLRDRPADIAPLARHFLERAATELGKPAPQLSAAASNALQAYTWPGNVRELENVMDRVAILCDGEIRPLDLLLEPARHTRPLCWEEIERRAIEDALAANEGNRTLAARQLGISLRKLQYRLHDYETRAKLAGQPGSKRTMCAPSSQASSASPLDSTSSGEEPLVH